MILAVGVEPEWQEASLGVCYDDLTAEELALVPAHGDLHVPVLVQTVDDVHVVVQVDAAVLHHHADACHVRAVPDSPVRAERLAKDFRRQLDRLDVDALAQVGFVEETLPVDALEGGHVGVKVNGVRPLVAPRRLDAHVVDETEVDSVETDVAHHIGNDQSVGPRLVVEAFEQFDRWSHMERWRLPFGQSHSIFFRFLLIRFLRIQMIERIKNYRRHHHREQQPEENRASHFELNHSYSSVAPQHY